MIKYCAPFLSLLLLLLLGQCTTESTIDHTKKLIAKNIPLSVGPSGMPNLFINDHGKTYLSWLAFENDSTDLLQYATLDQGQWSTPTTIAQGNDWFANWADFPSMVAMDKQGKQLAAHYLQYSATGTYDYDVKMSFSQDAGKNWSAALKPHQDTVKAEHGFVSLLPLNDKEVFATWLDGRYTKMVKPSAEEKDGHEHGGGPMTLRAANIQNNGKISDEVELDLRVCDCCQTDTAMGLEGPIVVYRDRSLEEIRDIYIVRKLNSGWTLPKVVHDDYWKIAGCPVNGPAVATMENQVAVAWYTMAQDTAKVMLALSDNAGADFKKVIRVDAGRPMGRVDLTYTHDQKAILLSWIGLDEEEQAYIYIRKIGIDGQMRDQQKIVAVAASRRSGFPILEKIEQGYLLAYTTMKGEKSSVVQTTILQ